ncbi:nicotinamide N-methyltransferase-like [Anomaloglossus baeobatrachus]|uniref:nicotinamide N-methyltransferase-like n=1 Tax=Anomaloglossus baeobatrachus TaxID=238106 RepID=UPI003F4F4F64
MDTYVTSQQKYINEFDARQFLQTYHRAKDGILTGEFTIFVMKHLHETFTKGGVRGHTLLDFGTGAAIYHLLSASEVFDEIIVSDLLEQNRAEFQKWLEKDPDAFDWTHIIKFVCELEGNGSLQKHLSDNLRTEVMDTPVTSQQKYINEFNAKQFLQTYHGAQDGVLTSEWTEFVIKNLHETFIKGGVRGDTLLDFGTGASIYHLLSACEVFDNIIVSDLLEENRAEFQKWLEKDPDAFDWTHIIKCVCELEGNGDDCDKKAEKLCSKVKEFLICDALKGKPFDPVDVSPVDCLLCCLCLEAPCKDMKSYCEVLKNFKDLIKPGGHLLVLSGLNATRYYVGANRFSLLSSNKEDLEKAFKEAGYQIEKAVYAPRVNNSGMEVADFRGKYFIHARKPRSSQILLDSFGL